MIAYNSNIHIPSGKVILYFSSSGCKNCQKFENNIVKPLEANHVLIIKADTDYPDVARIAVRLGIKVLPIFILYLDAKQVNQFIGLKTKEEFLKGFENGTDIIT